MAAQEKLAPFHSALLIYMIQSGVMAFVLPQRVAQNFGTNGWLAVIAFGLIAAINIALIGLVYKLGGGRTVFQILEQSLPKPILYPLYGAVAVIWTLLGCMAGKEYILIFQMYSFPTANPMLFKLVLDVLVVWLLTKGIYNIAKAATVFFFMFIWMVLLLFFFYPEFDWNRLTPFLFQGGDFSMPENVNIYSAFIGYELSLLLFGYANKQTKLIRGTFCSNGLLTFNFVYLAFMSFGVYSLEQLKNKTFPLLDLLAYIRLPFVERVENLFFGFFIFSVLYSVLMFAWAAGEMIGQMIPKVKKSVIGILLVVASFIVSYIPDSLDEVGQWLEVLSTVEIGIAFGLPLLLLIVLLAQGSRRKGDKHEANK